MFTFGKDKPFFSIFVKNYIKISDNAKILHLKFA